MVASAESGLKQYSNELHNQRKLKKKGGGLCKKREQLLESAGVVWDLQEQKWLSSYQMLLGYKAREGHCNVPCGYQEENYFWGLPLEMPQYPVGPS